MPNANYRRGANVERSVKRWLDKKGFLATRSAGSKGEFDVIGIGPTTDVLVQCKAGMEEKVARRLLDELVESVTTKFPALAHPILIVVIAAMSTKDEPTEMWAKALMPSEVKNAGDSGSKPTEADTHAGKETKE